MRDRIIADPAICGGEPVVKGTRIPVHVVLSHLAAGETIEKIVSNLPSLTRDDVLNCIEYGAYLATEKTVAG